MGLRCLHNNIFIEIPSLEGLPTKAKEDPSPHEMRLSPAGLLLLLLLLLLLVLSLLLLLVVVIVAVVAVVVVVVVI